MNIEETIVKIISNQSGHKFVELTGDYTSIDLWFDSLDEIEVIMKLEEKFDIEIPDSDAEKFLDVQSIIRYVTSAV
jgi:acyl carrier protein